MKNFTGLGDLKEMNVWNVLSTVLHITSAQSSAAKKRLK
jgi:hypothetical protein